MDSAIPPPWTWTSQTVVNFFSVYQDTAPIFAEDSPITAAFIEKDVTGNALLEENFLTPDLLRDQLNVTSFDAQARLFRGIKFLRREAKRQGYSQYQADLSGLVQTLLSTGQPLHLQTDDPASISNSPSPSAASSSEPSPPPQPQSSEPIVLVVGESEQIVRHFNVKNSGPAPPSAQVLAATTELAIAGIPSLAQYVPDQSAVSMLPTPVSNMSEATSNTVFEEQDVGPASTVPNNPQEKPKRRAVLFTVSTSQPSAANPIVPSEVATVDAPKQPVIEVRSSPVVLRRRRKRLDRFLQNGAVTVDEIFFGVMPNIENANWYQGPSNHLPGNRLAVNKIMKHFLGSRAEQATKSYRGECAIAVKPYRERFVQRLRKQGILIVTASNVYPAEPLRDHTKTFNELPSKIYLRPRSKDTIMLLNPNVGDHLLWLDQYRDPHGDEALDELGRRWEELGESAGFNRIEDLQDDPEEFDAATLREIEQEEKEKSRPARTNRLSLIQKLPQEVVIQIIDKAISARSEEIIKRLKEKMQRRAYSVWCKAKKFKKKRRLEILKNDNEEFMDRLEKMMHELANEPFSSEQEVRTRVVKHADVLLKQIEWVKWEMQLIKGPKPDKPVPSEKKVSRASRAKDANVSTGSDIDLDDADEEEDEEDDFIVEDDIEEYDVEEDDTDMMSSSSESENDDDELLTDGSPSRRKGKAPANRRGRAIISSEDDERDPQIGDQTGEKESPNKGKEKVRNDGPQQPPKTPRIKEEVPSAIPVTFPKEKFIDLTDEPSAPPPLPTPRPVITNPMSFRETITIPDSDEEMVDAPAAVKDFNPYKLALLAEFIRRAGYTQAIPRKTLKALANFEHISDERLREKLTSRDSSNPAEVCFRKIFDSWLKRNTDTYRMLHVSPSKPFQQRKKLKDFVIAFKRALAKDSSTIQNQPSGTGGGAQIPDQGSRTSSTSATIISRPSGSNPTSTEASSSGSNPISAGAISSRSKPTSAGAGSSSSNPTSAGVGASSSGSNPTSVGASSSVPTSASASTSPRRPNRRPVKVDKEVERRRQAKLKEVHNRDRREKEREKKEMARGTNSQEDENAKVLNPGRYATDDPIFIPKFLSDVIRPHQLDGIQFIWEETIYNNKKKKSDRGGTLLAHTMGLGKTLQIITLLYMIAKSASSKNEKIKAQIPQDMIELRTLILAPASLVSNWKEEFLKWIPSDGKGGLEYIGKLHVIDISSKLRARLKILSDFEKSGGVLLIGYELFNRLVKKDDMKPYLTKTPNLVIADEAHWLKNPATQRSKSVRLVKTTNRVALTGSPLSNSLSEYFEILDWLDKGYLGERRDFRAEFELPIEDGSYCDSTPKEKRASLVALRALYESIAPKVHRRGLDSLASQLTKKTEFLIAVPLTRLQQTLYADCVKEIRSCMWAAKAEGLPIKGFFDYCYMLGLILAHPSIFIHVLKLRKEKGYMVVDPRHSDDVLGEDKDGEKNKDDSDVESNGGPASPESGEVAVPPEREPPLGPQPEPQLDGQEVVGNVYDKMLSICQQHLSAHNEEDLKDIKHSHRMQGLIDILSKCRITGEKVLVFSKTLACLDFLGNVLDDIGIPHMRMDGSIPTSKRLDVTKKFNEDRNVSVFLISTRAGALGLNIPSASRVVIFDYGFSPSWEEQAIGRAYRLGQEKPVFVYRFRVGGTWEDKLHSTVLWKSQIAFKVVDKKNTMSGADRNQMMMDWFIDPSQIDQQPLQGFLGKDPIVLDKVLGQADFIREIKLQETFEQHHEENFTEAEIAEANKLHESLAAKRKARVSIPNLLNE